MSTLQATNLKNAASASNNIVLDSSGNATFAGTAAMASSFLRNRIINGDMRIDQRNNGASVTLDAGGVYTVDRFRGYEDTDGAMTAQRVTTAPTGFVNSLQVTTTTADASLSALQFCAVEQVIEGSNISDLGWGTASAQTVTLSFWVRSSLTGTFGGVLKNSAGTRSYPYTYSISVANTWEYKTVTIPGDTSGTWLTDTGMGIRVQFGLGVGSTYSGTAGSWAASALISATGAVSVIGTLNATWFLTGVQLEVGTVATPFERRQYGQELALCQRYYEKSFGQSQSLTTFDGAGRQGSYAVNSSDLYDLGCTMWKVTKRASPTATVYSSNSRTAGRVFSGSADVVASFNTATDSAGFLWSQTGAFSGGSVYVWHWTADAEL
jgi:hypothetical protein